MGKGYKHGESANLLNFRVVDGTSAPSAPLENTIWLKTGTALSGYAFSATQPANPVANMAWITTGTSGTVLNALKRNGIQLYLIAAKQYINGSWVPLEGYIYAAGSWVQFAYAIVYLYRNGDRNLSVTGDYYYNDTVISDGTASDGTKYLNLPNPGTYETANAYIKNKIDLTRFTTIVEKSIHSRPEGPGDSLQIIGADGSVVASAEAVGSSTMQTLAIDISNLNSEYSIRFHNFGQGYDNWDLYELYVM